MTFLGFQVVLGSTKLGGVDVKIQMMLDFLKEFAEENDITLDQAIEIRKIMAYDNMATEV